MIKTINIGIDSIDRIYHIADIHIRNVKRHKEYVQVFNKLYLYIKSTKTPNSVIYVAGDIVHTKTDMSPELVDLVHEFFRTLADIAPTIIITGNHDCNLNNSYRLDALTPIVKAIDHPNILYLKDTGVYKLANVHFNVFSVFDTPNNYISADDFKGDYKIALHHGAVNNASTDTGITLRNTSVTTNTFDGHDLVLLGDIHKKQYLNDEKTIAYPGSLIQQNHAEKLSHGMLVWDLKTKNSEFIKVENNYGYYTFEIDNGKILNPCDDIPSNPRLRLKVKDTPISTIKTLLTEIKKQYKVQEISLQKTSAFNEINSTGNKFNIGNVRDVEFQNNLITEYLIDKHALSDELLDRIRQINRTVKSKVSDTTLTRNITWVPKRFEFSNMFSYGEDNVIDFTNMEGTYGIFAPNHSGKSALLDALSFCIFDKSSKTTKAVNVLNNKKSTFNSVFQFEISGNIFFIHRSGKKNNRGHVKVNVDFWSVDKSGNKTSLNGDQRDSTNKNIRQYLGSYEDFVLTALSLQNNNTGFIDKSQRERKDLLSQFLDIDIFEQLYQIANEDIKETAALIRDYKNKDHSTTLADSEKWISQVTGSYEQMVKDKKEHEDMKSNLNDIIFNFMKDLKPVDDSLDEPEIIEKDIKELNLLLRRCKISINDLIGYLTVTEKELKDTNKKILDVNFDDLQERQKQNEDLVDKVKDLKNNKLKLKELKISHAEKSVDKLKDHKYDPNCKYCIQNSFVIDAEAAKKLLPTLQAERVEILNKIETLRKEIQSTSVERELMEYDELDVDKIDLESQISGYNVSLTDYNFRYDKLESKIKTAKQQLKKSKSQKDNIKYNKEINKQIKEIKDEIESVTSEITLLENKILSLSGKIKVAEKTKFDAIEAINRLKDLEQQYQGYEYYLQSIKRDGVPYYLITKALPQIESEINNILNQVVDFTVMLHTDGKNINGYIVYDDENYWPLELTSGMEKFISSLAIRTSLINVSNLPRPNFLAIDEGFGVLDSENLSSMYMLFDYLKSQFGFVMCISHIETMRDVVDKLIEINQLKGYSKMTFQ